MGEKPLNMSNERETEQGPVTSDKRAGGGGEMSNGGVAVVR